MLRSLKLDKILIKINFVFDVCCWIDWEEKKGDGMNSGDDLVDVFGVVNSRDGFFDFIDEFCFECFFIFCFGYGLCRELN